MHGRDLIGRPLGQLWTPPGLVRVAIATPSGATTTSLNACLSSLFRHYVVAYSLTNSANALQQVRLGVGGTPDANANYNNTGQYWIISTAVSNQYSNVNSTSFQLNANGGTERTEGTFWLYNPQVAVKTTGVSNLVHSNGSTLTDGVFITSGMFYNGTAQFTDIQFLQNTGTHSGIIEVFGVE